ncbi:MAG: type VII toxin-antitoxin system MntA family adenylyltransferase antitoxin [Desulfitobacteriaceae bacterium]
MNGKLDMETLIIEYLVRTVDPVIIMIFGSFVKGNIREDSDIDIAFLSDKAPSSYELFLLAQGLAAKMGRDVDLIDLKQVSTVFKAQVIGTGKVIYASDMKRLADFRIRSLKDYALLNEERAEIVKSISARGRVYSG